MANFLKGSAEGVEPYSSILWDCLVAIQVMKTHRYPETWGKPRLDSQL